MAAVLLLASLLAAAAQPPQASPPHCAIPATGIDTTTACDSIPGLLAVAIRFSRRSADIQLSHVDVEAIYLAALGRVLQRGVRADSAWAFAQRDTSHVWADVEVVSERQLRVAMLYWSWQPDATLTKLCQFTGTLEVPRNSIATLGAMLGGEIQDLARCAQRRAVRLDPTRDETRDREEPAILPLVALPVALSILAFALVWWFVLRRPQPDFWRLAARYPDKAYEWFLRHDEWLVIDPEAGKMPKPDDREFEGPHLLWVPQLGGRRVAVYGRLGQAKESQEAFLRVHGLDSDGLFRS